MKRLLTTATLALLMTTAAQAAPERAMSEPYPMYTGTYWRTAYHPLNSGGEPMCVTAGGWNFRNGASATMMLKWQASLGLFIHVTKSNWRFPEDVDVPLSILMDAGTRDGVGVTMKNASGVTSMIQININGTGQNFIRDFAAANRMVIKFKSGNEPPWEAQMQGSSEAAQALLKCVAHIGGGVTSPVPPQATSPVQPRTTSPVPPQATTSPVSPPTSPVKQKDSI